MDETLKRITANNPEIEFHFIFDKPFDQSFIYGKNVIGHVVFPPTKHVAIFDLWFNVLLPRKIKKIKANYFLSLDGITSTKLSIPNHLVIHDINFEHRPQDLPKAPRNYYLKRSKIFSHLVTQIATVSKYSKTDIVNTYQVDSNKIDVVYNAAKQGFNPLSDTDKQLVKKEFSDGKEYFLYVGSLHPRKNLKNLLLAFDAFKSSTTSNKLLLVVGNVMWKDTKLQEVLKNCIHKNDVVFTGRKSDLDLQKIVGAAFALTYVPHFEGFGIPIVEAYACAVPVITSNLTSLPEIAEDGAICVDPESVSQIANAMEQLTKDNSKRQKLIENGQKIIQKYSWDKTANLYWNSVQKIFKR